MIFRTPAYSFAVAVSTWWGPSRTALQLAKSFWFCALLRISGISQWDLWSCVETSNGTLSLPFLLSFCQAFCHFWFVSKSNFRRRPVLVRWIHWLWWRKASVRQPSVCCPRLTAVGLDELRCSALVATCFKGPDNLVSRSGWIGFVGDRTHSFCSDQPGLPGLRRIAFD